MAYIGSKGVETSKANTELVSYKGKNKDFTEPAYFHALTFNPTKDCTVKVNGGEEFAVPANASLVFGKNDETIKSFIIKEAGIQYLWLATI